MNGALHCACCSRLAEAEEQIAQLKDALAPRCDYPAEWQLTGQQRVIFSTMMPRSVAHYDQLVLAMSIKDHPKKGWSERASRQNLQVQVAKMRKKLAPFGVSIRTVIGVGYSLREH